MDSAQMSTYVCATDHEAYALIKQYLEADEERNHVQLTTHNMRRIKMRGMEYRIQNIYTCPSRRRRYTYSVQIHHWDQNRHGYGTTKTGAWSLGCEQLVIP
jgi:hypothetical protein